MKALQLTVLELFIEAASSPLTLLMATCVAEVSPHCATENGWDHSVSHLLVYAMNEMES